MLAPLALAAALSAGPMDGHGPYNPAVPTPASVLGYELGAKHTVYHDQDRVTKAIAATSPRVRAIEYGKSTEGRPLRVFAISSPANIAKLEEIRRANEQLALGTSTSKDSPAIVWVNQCIHGDETASFESGMQLIYTLAASDDPKVKDALENSVVIVNPVYNPDGHERYVVAYNSIPTGNPGPGSYDRAVPNAFFGRHNHYRFDMNRDRIAMSQAETQQEVALFLRWNPQVYVDQHGQVDTYFFPPVQQSVNTNVDRARYDKWTEIFGRATARDFDSNGWTYFIRNAFDLYNACYLDSHTSLMGAIGMTHETDGGRVMATEREDGSTLTLRDGIEKHFVSAMAVIRSAASNRSDLVESFAKFKQDAVSGKHAGKFRRVILESDDPRELRRIATHLGRSGITVKWPAQKWRQKTAHDYWTATVGKREFGKNTLIIEMAQAQGPLAKALLEPNSDFEPDFIARQKALAKARKENRKDTEIDSFEFYDSTAWALPYGYNLKAWWCEDAPSVTVRSMPDVVAERPPVSPVGYYWRYSDREDALFAAAALKAGHRISVARKPMKVGGETLPNGTFMALAARNENLAGLMDLAISKQIALKPLSTSYPDAGREGPGSESIVQLRRPKIGVVFGGAGNLSGGSLWYLLEQQFRLPFAGLSTQGLNQSLDSYTSIVIPGGVDVNGNTNLLNWVRAGGCLVILEAPGWAFGEKGFQQLTSSETESALPGAIFLAQLERTSPLACGYAAPATGPIPVAVPIEGGSFVKSPKAASDVKLSGDKKLLSGWSWDETEKDLNGIAWAHVAQYGRGRAVLFTQDPTYRAQYPGLEKMLLNAMLIGPSW